MMGFPRSRLSSVLQQQHILSPRPFSAEVTPQFIPTANINRRRFRSNTRNQAPLQPTSKRTRAPAQSVFQKSIHVFEFDPHNSARFTKTSDNVVVTGVLSPIAVSATEAEVREEIRDFIQHARSDSHLFVDVKSYDFEFIQVSGKNAQVPSSSSSFTWSGSAVKSLAGQGAVYIIRLLKRFRKAPTPFNISSDSDSDFDLPLVRLRSHPMATTSSSEQPQCSSSSLSQRPMTQPPESEQPQPPESEQPQPPESEQPQPPRVSITYN